MTTAMIAMNEHKRLCNLLSTQLLRYIRETIGECENCGGKENLTIHHIRGHNGRKTDYGDNLVVLCMECHHALHVLEIKPKRNTKVIK